MAAPPSATPTPAPAPATAPAMATRDRPLGITILSVLYGIGGVLMLLSALGMMFLGGMFGAAMFGADAGALGALGAAAFFVMGAFVLVFGLLALVGAYGLWKGEGWAWTLAMILIVLGILLGVLSLPFGIVTLLVNVFLIWYFTRDGVKAWFGKVPSAA